MIGLDLQVLAGLRAGILALIFSQLTVSLLCLSYSVTLLAFSKQGNHRVTNASARCDPIVQWSRPGPATAATQARFSIWYAIVW